MEILVKPKQLSNAVGRVAVTPANLKKASLTISTAMMALRNSAASYGIIESSLRQYSDDLNNVAKSVKRANSSMSEIIRAYTSTEKAIIGKAAGKNYLREALGDAGWAFASKVFGPVGPVIGIGKAAADGKYEKIPGKIYDIYDKVKENTNGSKVDWKGLLGLEKYTDPVGKVKEKLSSKATWIFAVLESGVDNYREHGAITARWAGETGVEAAINVGEAALIGLGVGAVAATIGAPVCLTGAITAAGVVVVDAGINGIVRWATGNPKADWKESVSDFVCDTGEKIVKGVSDVVDNVGKTVSKGWNNLVNAVSSAGSSARWGFFGR